jgi:hypothetical protein
MAGVAGASRRRVAGAGCGLLTNCASASVTIIERGRAITMGSTRVQAYWASLELSRNLSRAMESRGVIEQAKGILMSTRRVTADDAFDLLVARSQTENRKLREVAGDVIREALGGDDG